MKLLVSLIVLSVMFSCNGQVCNNEILQSENGTIASPGYLNSTDVSNTTCMEWTIKVSETSRIYLMLTDFVKDGNDEQCLDNLEIFDGGNDSDTLIFELCEAPFNTSFINWTFISSGNVFFLRYTFIDRNSGTGFYAYYYSVMLDTNPQTLSTTQSTTETTQNASILTTESNGSLKLDTNPQTLSTTQSTTETTQNASILTTESNGSSKLDMSPERLVSHDVLVDRTKTTQVTSTLSTKGEKSSQLADVIASTVAFLIALAIIIALCFAGMKKRKRSANISVRFFNKNSDPHLLPNYDFEGIEGFESHELTQTLDPTIVNSGCTIDLMVSNSDSTSARQKEEPEDDGEEQACEGSNEE